MKRGAIAPVLTSLVHVRSPMPFLQPNRSYPFSEIGKLKEPTDDVLAEYGDALELIAHSRDCSQLISLSEEAGSVPERQEREAGMM